MYNIFKWNFEKSDFHLSRLQRDQSFLTGRRVGPRWAARSLPTASSPAARWTGFRSHRRPYWYRPAVHKRLSSCRASSRSPGPRSRTWASSCRSCSSSSSNNNRTPPISRMQPTTPPLSSWELNMLPCRDYRIPVRVPWCMNVSS